MILEPTWLRAGLVLPIDLSQVKLLRAIACPVADPVPFMAAWV
jgi:hypothetical protein